MGPRSLETKSRYPRDYWCSALTYRLPSSDESDSDRDEKAEKSSPTLRDDIPKYKWKLRKDIHGFEYPQERSFEFRDSLDLSHTVETMLSDKDYVKRTMRSKTVYQVKDSPIARIELKKNSFKMITSSEYALRERPWS